MKTKKILLPDQMIPVQWYNIVADMPQKPLPPLDPRTRRPVTAEQMNCIFAEELVRQEFSTERFIDIPDEVRNLYRIWRCTPLVRADALERALDTPAKIYFKNESVSPAGSHKPNTALPQAYYNAKQGIKHLTTETGGGQWGSAIALASQYFGLDLKVFMVKVSYEQKPYRKLLMNTWGAEVIPSPSTLTDAGRRALADDPDCSGNLGLAISEAVETAVQHPRRVADEREGKFGSLGGFCHRAGRRVHHAGQTHAAQSGQGLQVAGQVFPGDRVVEGWQEDHHQRMLTLAQLIKIVSRCGGGIKGETGDGGANQMF